MKLACMCLELGAWVQARVLPIKGLVAAAAGRPIWGRHQEATTACFCCPFQLGAGFHLVSLFQGNIVALVHDSGDTQDEENDILLNGLSHQSHLILRAEGLATGFCRDVHGQVRRGRDPPGNRLPASECRRHEGRRRAGGVGGLGSCVRARQSPLQRALGAMCRCGFLVRVPFVTKVELLKRRLLSGVRGRAPLLSCRTPLQDYGRLRIQVHTAPSKIGTWGGLAHGTGGCCPTAASVWHLEGAGGS